MLNADKPDGVNNIQHDSITCESFIIRWDNVSDIFPVTYTVRWYRVDGDDETDITTGISYPVTGLANSTYYNVTVTANNTCCGAGQISDIIMVMTNNVCPSPTIITVTTTTITPDIVTPTVNMTEPPTGNLILVCFYYIELYINTVKPVNLDPGK